MKKRVAVIISCSDQYSYGVRTKFVEKALAKLGFECEFITADFNHRDKKKYIPNRDNVHLIHVPQYKKNLSIKRMASHIIFAYRTKKYLEYKEPDLIYCNTTPNSLFHFISRYKNNTEKTKLVFDIGDLWPETLPFPECYKIFFSPVLSIWASLRNRNIRYADAILSECKLFSRKINKYICDKNNQVIYLARTDNFDRIKCNSSSEVNIAYIGSINNIIDINLILNLLIAINKKKKVNLYIIGDGEKTEVLIDNLKQKGIAYQYFGMVYDDIEKSKILKDCQFGLNIMQNSVVVGLTMKSIEYLHWGLALLNNIPADTEEIINEEGCGFNIQKDGIDEIASTVCKITPEEINNMKIRARNTYIKYFSENIVVEKFYGFFSGL